MAAFPTGNPREDQLETVICKHCKRPVLKQAAAEHIRGCLRAKQEKARKKKEARDAANRAKEKASDGSKDGVGEDGKAVDDASAAVNGGDKADGEDAMKGQKSAKKSAVKGMADGDGPKKGKKRKADGEEDKGDRGEPKKKKKKEEPKPKVPKPKGPVDVEKQCGVTLPNGAQCARSLTCKSHSMGAKRAVPGRSLPYDMLLQAYQKKNQARQQSKSSFTTFTIHCMQALTRRCRSGHRRQRPAPGRLRQQRPRGLGRGEGSGHGRHRALAPSAPRHAHADPDAEEVPVRADEGDARPRPGRPPRRRAFLHHRRSQRPAAWTASLPAAVG